MELDKKHSSTHLILYKIIRLLIKNISGLTNQELMDKLGLKKSSISKYIKILREKGLEYFGFTNYEYISERKNINKKSYVIHKIRRKNYDHSMDFPDFLNNDKEIFSFEYNVNIKFDIDFKNFIFDFTDELYRIFPGARLLNDISDIENDNQLIEQYNIETDLCLLDVYLIKEKNNRNTLKIKVIYKWNYRNYEFYNIIISDPNLIKNIIKIYFDLFNWIIVTLIGPIKIEFPNLFYS